MVVKSNKSINFNLFFSYLLCAFSLILLCYKPISPSIKYQFVCLVIVILSVLNYAVAKYKQGIGWFSFSSIFILGFVIVHFQIISLQVFGYHLPHYSYYKVWGMDSIENISTISSLIAMQMFMIGSFHGSKIKVINKNLIRTDSTFFLLLFTYVFYVLFFSTSGSYKYGEYAAGDSLAGSNYFLKLFNIFLIASIISNLSKISRLERHGSLVDYLNLFNKPLLAILFWHLAFSLFVGDRGVIITYGILIFSLYFYRWKRLKIHQVVISILAISVFLSIVGEVRQSRYSGDSYSERIQQSLFEEKTHSRWYDQNVPGASFIELAQSVRTLNHAIYNVPDNYDYKYGMYQLKRIIAVIPGASGIFNQVISNGEWKYDDTANFISFLIQGENPTYGDGTSITADLYLDFGFLGMYVGLLIFGLIIGCNEPKLISGNQDYLNLGWIAILVFLSKSLYLSRSSISLEYSTIILVWCALYINYHISNSFSKVN